MRARSGIVLVFLISLIICLPYLSVAGGDTKQTVDVGGSPLTPVVDTSNGDVYVADGRGNDVSVISGTSLIGTVDMAVNARGVTQTSANLFGATFDPADGYVYVTNANGNEGGGLGVISGTTLEGYAHVEPDGQSAAVYDSNNGYVYLPLGEQQTVNRSGQVTATFGEVAVVHDLISVANITVGLEPDVGVFDPNNGDIYISDNGTVDVISGTTSIASIPVGQGPYIPVVDTSDGDVYVPNWTSGTVTIISGSTNSVLGTVDLGSAAYLVYNQFDGKIYALGASELWAISGTSITGSLSLTPYAAGIPAYDPNDGYVYISASGGVVDAVSGTTIAHTDDVGGSPGDITFDPVNGYLYVSDDTNGVLDVIIPAGTTAATSGTSATSLSSSSASTTSASSSSGSSASTSSFVTGSATLSSSSATGTSHSSHPIGTRTLVITGVAIGTVAVVAGVSLYLRQRGKSDVPANCDDAPPANYSQAPPPASCEGAGPASYSESPAPGSCQGAPPASYYQAGPATNLCSGQPPASYSESPPATCQESSIPANCEDAPLRDCGYVYPDRDGGAAAGSSAGSEVGSGVCCSLDIKPGYWKKFPTGKKSTESQCECSCSSSAEDSPCRI